MDFSFQIVFAFCHYSICVSNFRANREQQIHTQAHKRKKRSLGMRHDLCFIHCSPVMPNHTHSHRTHGYTIQNEWQQAAWEMWPNVLAFCLLMFYSLSFVYFHSFALQIFAEHRWTFKVVSSRPPPARSTACERAKKVFNLPFCLHDDKRNFMKWPKECWKISPHHCPFSEAPNVKRGTWVLWLTN